jgi:hypothetical protein
MNEEWRDVVGYAGIYEVSNLGRVKNVKSGRILKSRQDKRGYVRALLYRDKGVENCAFHRLVAAAFISPCPKGHGVIHLDYDLANNRAENLRYVTKSDRVKHSFKAGRNSTRGERSPTAKLNEEQVKEILVALSEGVLQRELAAKYEVSRAQIGHIRSGRNWGHLRGGAS